VPAEYCPNQLLIYARPMFALEGDAPLSPTPMLLPSPTAL